MFRLIAISVILGMLAWVLKPMGPYLEYALKREFIVNNYCVNQDKPALKCNGSCYLMQRLKAQAENHEGSGKVALQELNVEVMVVIPKVFSWIRSHQDSKRIHSLKCVSRTEWVVPPTYPPPQIA